ncbi:hypothetical protein QFZ78_003352 [Paenibacillus sp. V4I5]|nr:hypothetical protein [Paenibacillus sp. V4I5]
MNNQRINRSDTGVGELTEGQRADSPLVLRARNLRASKQMMERT